MWWKGNEKKRKGNQCNCPIDQSKGQSQQGCRQQSTWRVAGQSSSNCSHSHKWRPLSLQLTSLSIAAKWRQFVSSESACSNLASLHIEIHTGYLFSFLFFSVPCFSFPFFFLRFWIFHLFSFSSFLLPAAPENAQNSLLILPPSHSSKLSLNNGLLVNGTCMPAISHRRKIHSLLSFPNLRNLYFQS